MKNGLVSTLRVIEDCSIIAAVGESMSNMPGVSGLFFGALGQARINVLSISQVCMLVCMHVRMYIYSCHINSVEVYIMIRYERDGKDNL